MINSIDQCWLDRRRNMETMTRLRDQLVAAVKRTSYWTSPTVGGFTCRHTAPGATDKAWSGSRTRARTMIGLQTFRS